MRATPLLVNPAADRGAGRRLLPGLRELAAVRGLAVVVTASVEELRREARRAAGDGRERLLVAGGDGTFHHAVQELAGSATALGMIPMGSGNDLPATLGVPLELPAALEVALDAQPRPIDLGRAGQGWFAIYCGVGFDGEVARRNRRVRRLRGRAAYVYAVLRELAAFVPPRLRVEHDHGIFEGEATMAIAANCPRFGGGMRIAPAARPDDGALDLVIVEKIRRLELLRVFPGVYRGRHVGHPAVSIVRTRRAAIASDRPLAPWVDGEELVPPPGSPLRIELAAGALLVAVPGERRS